MRTEERSEKERTSGQRQRRERGGGSEGGTDGAANAKKTKAHKNKYQMSLKSQLCTAHMVSPTTFITNNLDL